ncbi:MAG: LuxR family transcriptional regulator [Paenibacillus sp.]|jgi:DNA-binding NarL/FixJ family response regulator|nr:LuxR family transcriptional regulator [Paenibacillus sp.]
MSVKKLKLTVDSHINSAGENEKLALLHSMIVKEVSAMDFLDKVTITLESTAFFAPSMDLADNVHHSSAAEGGDTGKQADRPIHKLSERQRQVAELLCGHYSIKRIASIMYVSENTVKKHVQNIKKALMIEQSGADFIFSLKQMLDGNEGPNSE